MACPTSQRTSPRARQGARPAPPLGQLWYGSVVDSPSAHPSPNDSSSPPSGPLSAAVATTGPASRFEILHRIGIALASERNRDRLLEKILTEAQGLCHADGGSLYLVTDDKLAFEIVRTASLGISLGGTTGVRPSFPALPLYLSDGRPNVNNIATFAAHQKKPVHVPDAYNAVGFDFSGTKIFDQKNGYLSRSFFTVPLVNGEGDVIGVLQLLNATDPLSGERIPFDVDHQETVTALAAQAALALDNKLLLEAQKELLESFIKLLAAAIDSKSPYTGGHCERVPVLTEMLVGAIVGTREGPFAGFTLDDDGWYELRIAAWLHDCGKVTTPVHVMDKATKLEAITDRIATVRHRFSILERDAKLRLLERKLELTSRGEPVAEAERECEAELETLAAELAFLEHANLGGEFLPPDAQAKIRAIGRRTFAEAGAIRPLLDDDELENLCISRGTLTEDERLVINGHMVQTLRMLEALPLPRNLRRVPEYAACHHEKMDGTGYPRGIFAGDLSIPARAMAIADVFEALTASDRPYKKGKTLSESMRIMGFMKRDGHLDPALFDAFVTSGVYRKYAERYLPRELLDDVDEAALLAISPKPFSLPDEAVRKARFDGLLEVYERRFPVRNSTVPSSALPGSSRAGAAAVASPGSTNAARPHGS